MNELFAKYQKPLLKIVNHPLGRKYIGINPKKKIVGLAPNAFAVREENRIKAEFRCYSLFAKKLGLALHGYNSLLEGIKYYFTPQEIRFLEFALRSGNPIYPSTGDGSVHLYQPAPDRTMAYMRSQASGSTARPTETPAYAYTNPWSSGAYPQILTLARGFIPFITSAIGKFAKKKSAILSIYVTTLNDDWPSEAESALDIIQTTQASMTDLVLSDYSKITLNTPDLGSARKDLADITASQYNNFTLNATGLGWIDIVGNTKLGMRDGHDVDNQPVNAGLGDNSYKSGITFSTSEQADTDQDPKLIVIYTVPGGSALLHHLIS
ncbi:MAG TPA: hypothetical protein ENI23_14515 [bacterium]|nr:hypothetical protein [bacterium]